MNKRNTPKVSIITVVYNGAKTIRQTIESVRNQTYQNIEYIIVDGGSKDATIDIINEYSDSVSLLISEPDDGLYYAMNKGIELCTGELIGILNSDDWYEADIVANVVKKHNKVGGDIYYCDFNLVYESGNIEKAYVGDLSDIWHFNPIGHCTAFVTKKTYDKIGLYDTKYKYAADYDFFFRAYIAKKEFIYIKKILSNFRIGGLSTGDREIETLNEVRMIQSSFFSFCPRKDFEIIRIIDFHRRGLFAAMMKKELIKKKIRKCVEEMMDGYRTVYVFGAGNIGRKVFNTLSDINIKCSFIDNDKGKCGTRYNGAYINEACVLETQRCAVIVSIADKKDVMLQINNYNNDELLVIDYRILANQIEELLYCETINWVEETWRVLAGSIMMCGEIS